MAKIRLRKKGKVYFGRVTVDGRRVERTTGCTDEATALAVVESWEHDAAHSRSEAATTLNDALNLLINDREAKARQGSRSPRTVGYYRTTAGHLVAHFGHQFRIGRFVDSSLIFQYIDAGRADGGNDPSIRQDLKTLRSALGIARERGLWTGDERLAVPSTFNAAYEPRDRSPTRQEILKLLPNLSANSAAAVAFILATTAETSAFEAALKADIPKKFDGATVPLRGTKNEYRDRDVPIVTKEQAVLLEYARRHAKGDKTRVWIAYGAGRQASSGLRERLDVRDVAA